MRMLHLLTILVAAGCGEKNKPEPLSKTKSPLSEEGQHTNQDSKAKATAGSKLWEFITESAVFSSPVIGSNTMTSGQSSVPQDNSKLSSGLHSSEVMPEV